MLAQQTTELSCREIEVCAPLGPRVQRQDSGRLTGRQQCRTTSRV
jgi:hypothetical protein